MKSTWIIFDRRTCRAGQPAEGAVVCVSCGAHEEIGALASEAEGEQIRRDFAGHHAPCGARPIAARRYVERERDSSAGVRA